MHPGTCILLVPGLLQCFTLPVNAVLTDFFSCCCYFEPAARPVRGFAAKRKTFACHAGHASMRMQLPQSDMRGSEDL